MSPQLFVSTDPRSDCAILFTLNSPMVIPASVLSLAYPPTTAETDAMFDDHYQALWVPRDASDDEIKKAYYALARDCHPDLHANDEAAKKKFQRIQRAFEVLGDPEKREKYNREYDAKFLRIPTPPPEPPPVQFPRESQEAHDSVAPNSSASPSPGARTGATPSAGKKMGRRPGSRGSPAIAVMRIVFGGIAGILLGLLTLAMFFPSLLWNEQAYRDPPSQQQTSRPYNRRTQPDRPREKPAKSRLEPIPTQPDNSAAPPEPPKNLASNTPEAVPNRVPADPESRTLAREITNTIGMKLMRIDPGEFMMGSPVSEGGPTTMEALHRVTLTKPYMIGVTEVTQGQWQAIIGNDPSHFKGTNLPVEQVSWNDALEFCRRLSEREGKQYRLPTEAEWEYACRAGTTTAYNTGEESSLPSAAWYKVNCGKNTHPVGQKKPNAWGLYDMHGNVWEWCSDVEQAFPLQAATGPTTGTLRSTRGGSWDNDPWGCRSASRMGVMPSDRYFAIGFRVVLDLVKSDESHTGTVAESAESGEDSSTPLKKTKSPVPHPDQQAAAMKLVGEAFHLGADRTTAEKRKLAADLLRAASEPDREVNERYALLTIAADVAADSGDAQLCVACIDQMAALFQVDSLAIKKSKIMKAISSTKDESIMGDWVNAAKAAVRELILADQFEDALNVTVFAYDACDKRGFKTLRKLLFDARTAIRTERENWDTFQMASAALQKDSTDKDTNLTVGRWQCLENDDWMTGLEHLSRGSDEELVIVAKRELAGATTTDDRTQLADSWFDLAAASEKNRGFLVRAMFWYQQVQNDVSGLSD